MRIAAQLGDDVRRKLEIGVVIRRQRRRRRAEWVRQVRDAWLGDIASPPFRQLIGRRRWGVQRLINTRIESGRSTQGELDLRQHLEQLKVLFGEIERVKVSGSLWSGLAQTSLVRVIGAVAEADPPYPSEDFEALVVRQSERKKRRNERLLQTDRV